jgi:hypothetical protein|tara:strand:+ start:388 stop:552 length:165 start_codon:yes stop_codon:yes gene_type:complete
MIKLTDILKKKKKPIKEFALMTLGLTLLIKKVIIPWLQKNPELKDDLKKEVEKL